MTEQQWLAEIKGRAAWLRVAIKQGDANTIRRDRALLIGDILAYWQMRDPGHMADHHEERRQQLRGMTDTELIRFAH